MRSYPRTNENLIVQDAETPFSLLVIEDNPGDVRLIKEILKSAGINFNLSNAISLRDAVALLRSSTFDIILLDLGLPDSTGINTLKELLSYEFSQPIIVMTGLDDEDTALASLREGAQDYIVKHHIETVSLVKSIKYSIERKKVENLIKKHNHRLAVMSNTTAALHEGDDVQSVYNLICQSIRQLLGDVYVISVELDHTMSGLVRVSNLDQFTHRKDEIYRLLNFDLDNPVFPANQKQIDIVNSCTEGKVRLIEKGLFGLMGEAISEESCLELERLLGLKYIFLSGFLKNDLLFGGVIFYTPFYPEDEDFKVIENLCSQASLGIFRRKMKENLVLSEAKYQRLAGELEEKVLERTRELEAVNEHLRVSEAQLRELNATKDKFFNIVAHDLKNPFTSLLGATEVLTQNIEGMDREKIKRLAQILNDSSKSGYAILLNLLDWSRSQTGLIKINPQNLNIKKVLQDNIADLYLSSLDKEIEITEEIMEEITVFVDKNMINTILRNLLSNAIKFTRRGGKVHIKCLSENRFVKVSIKDNGIGIPAEYIDKLFRIDSKFSRHGTEKELGTGLGLKLCREFVEKLGGKIWVESFENRGSEFCFTLPLK